jgi:hypothetical protein
MINPMFTRPASTLPRALTTLDLLKAWAVLIMVIDHIGFFFVPESGAYQSGDPALWWRVIGRLCVPVWFFLIGYARTRDTSWPICTAAFFMLISAAMFGLWVFPLNILFTMIFIRLILDPVAKFALKTPQNLAITIVLIFMTSFHTFFLFEYGSVGLLVALFGYAVRNQNKGLVMHPEKYRIDVLYWASLALLVVIQGIFFTFDRGQFAVMTLGTAGVLYILQHLRPHEHQDLANTLGPAITDIIQLLGRHTLAFYVIHLTLFRMSAWGLGIGLPLYGFMDWDLWIWDAFARARTQ